MNNALISIGSNENEKYNLIVCRKLLDKQFSDIFYSETCITSPYGTNYKKDFTNQLAITKTKKTKEEVIDLLKDIERKMGRISAHKKEGVVIIDIDLVKWNNEILKPEDMSRHYVKDLIPTLPSK